MSLALGKRRAAGHHEDRDIVAGGVDHAHERVGQAHIYMHHHRLRLARGHVVPVRHGHRGGFMGRDDGGGDGQVRLLVLGVSFDDGRKVGACIGEQIVDAMLFEPHQNGFSRGFRNEVLGQFRHGVTSHLRIWPGSQVASSGTSSIRPSTVRARRMKGKAAR